MENWIVDNANLLSGLAGIVTLLSIVLAAAEDETHRAVARGT